MIASQGIKTAQPAGIPSQTDDMMGGFGAVMQSLGSKFNQPTNPSPQFDLTRASPGRLQANNYLLAEMNIPTLSPLSKRMNQQLFPQTT